MTEIFDLADSPPERLAYLAVEAIERAVTGLSDEIERAIGEAAFGLGKFKGRVSDRQDQLASEHPYVSRNVYAKHRPTVFNKVIFALEREQQPEQTLVQGAATPPQPVRASVNRAGVDTVTWAFTEFARRAATFYYSGLACLFAGEHLDWLEPNPYRSDGYRQCVEDVFFSHVELLGAPVELYRRLGCVHWPKRPVNLPADPAAIFEATLNDPNVERYLASQDRQRLVQLFNSLIDQFPLSSNEYELIVKEVPFGSRLKYAGRFDTACPAWTTWWMQQPGGSLVDDARALEEILRCHINYAAPVTKNAERRALKLLSVFYETDEWVPDTSGVALKDQLHTYFAANEARLVKS